MPDRAESFALIVDDPDAPGGVFTHWLLYNLPAASQHLPAGILPEAGGMQGTNDFGALGYGPPCPPSGRAPHRYHWTLYALDALHGHVLDESRIYGSYRRHG